ncbi:hypothetical protein PVAP13_7KG105189 [Panicum virgatum]|uniref:Uncharacterized protein n=1 Tax=Panicum virgatum TaxID=38727 RepID=A0A8T0QLC8_PANVG|nr:hypothetical protein PVAP13_7KG105189 [Panicum virgatum]
MAMAVNPITSLHEVELLVQTPDAHRVIRIDGVTPLRDAERMVATLMPMVRDYGWCVDRRGLGRLRVAMTLDLDLQFLSSVAIMCLYREPWDAVTIQNLERAGFEVQRTARRTGGSIQQPADEIGARARHRRRSGRRPRHASGDEPGGGPPL